MTSKTVLITGAAHRIGAAIARDLHNSGMNIIIHHHNSAEAASNLGKELNASRTDSAYLVQGDLLAPDSYAEIVQQAFGFKQRLDVLINNASTFFPTRLGEIDLEQWQSIIGVNLQAPLFLTQQAAPHLAEHKGCVINMTDIHGLRPLRDHAVYSSAKAGLLMLTQALAKDLAPAIRVNAISPGAILWSQDMPEDKQSEIINRTALKKTGSLEDITNAVRFLINDADYMTGQVLTIDGGRTLYS
ncbi:MAG: pteridine reductase [Gammaproteobacteria bacterium]|jgi:pteridine reductase|nr:pteridine reductase [Gammaproteobacteria bacterium]